jgi:hypothetical protein
LAGVAQSVEQLIRNEKVGGSIPLSGTKSNGLNFQAIFFVCRFRDQHKELRHGAFAGTPGFLCPKPIFSAETRSVLDE